MSLNKISDTRIDLMRDSATTMPQIVNPQFVLSARIWHCKYKSLSPVKELINLEELVMATVPDASLDFLRPLRKLKYLSIIHMPKISELDPIMDLTRLETLTIRTLPSWDSSKKKTVIRSLDPLRTLVTLKHVELVGVIPEDKSLVPLEALPVLETLVVSPFAQKEQMGKFFAKGVKELIVPPSSFE